MARLRALLCATAALAGCSLPPQQVQFSQSSPACDAYGFVEVTANVSTPHAWNPFTDASLEGWFGTAGGGRRWRVEGFCDADDGSVFRIRFMPPAPGAYTYAVTFRQGGLRRNSQGTFTATDARRRGLVGVDPQYPWHFIWQGTGEHYFFHGATAYWLLGWQDDRVIEACIERLARWKVNRLRVTLAGRTNTFYGEPVMPGRNWTPFLTPWPARRANDLFRPGFDYGRFDLAFWRKCERALRFARGRDMIVSLVLDMNDSRVHPSAGGRDERRFIRYAVARLGAFSNVNWDLGDDLEQYRDDRWTHETGTLLKQWDPYRHLATSHPSANEHQDRASAWFDFTSLQEWSRDQHAFMLGQRSLQRRSGRIIPQTNEEYGYEDHYPAWAMHLGPSAGNSAAALRRSAWDIVMAGGYQTTGESARRGTNVWPDTGGGWMNGRGDDNMTMLQGYAHMVDFFTRFEWWKTEPHDELVTPGAYCLARPGETYAIYLPRGGSVSVQLQPGRYAAAWFDPAAGRWLALPDAARTTWASPPPPGPGDWALLLERQAPRDEKWRAKNVDRNPTFSNAGGSPAVR